MDRSEVTSSGLIDYSKAFDNIDYRNLLGKIQNMNFVKYTNMLPICTIRTQEIGLLLPMFLRVPQGSILGTVLFNLYVGELANRKYSTTVQCAHDTTLYRHCKISKLHEFAAAIQKDVEKLPSWSQQNNLIFNCNKLESIVFSSSRLSAKHNREDSSLLFVALGNLSNKKEM